MEEGEGVHTPNSMGLVKITMKITVIMSGLSMSFEFILTDICASFSIFMSFSNVCGLPCLCVLCLGVVDEEPSSPPRPPSLGCMPPPTAGSLWHHWSFCIPCCGCTSVGVFGFL